MTSYIYIDPHDTMFFRDGRPFNQNDAGAAAAVSMFPPPPSAIAMMLRTALAAGQGWTHGSWISKWNGKPSDFNKVMGDGPDDLGKLSFSPPVLVKDNQFVFPMPLALVRHKENICLERLYPGAQSYDTDMGSVRLPEIRGQGWAPLTNAFLTAKGMRCFLEGGVPCNSDVLEFSDLAEQEPRTGIKKDQKTRAAEDGKLYAASHMRLKKGLRLLAGVTRTDRPLDWKLAPVRPMGGEGRFSWLESVARTDIPSLVTNEIEPDPRDGIVRYTVTLITPFLPPEESDGEKPDARLPGRVVTACVGKPLMLGGWSSHKGGPLPLRPHLPAGTVWFMEVPRESFDENSMPLAIGSKTEYGFGGCLYGVWKEKEQNTKKGTS
jgi:CRISPR-associated protein Cmr3